MTLATLVALLAPRALAQDVLLLDFDDPADPFLDSSAVGHTLSSVTFTEDLITGAGVTLDGATPTPGGGYAAWFDGGSALEFGPSTDLVFAAADDFTLRFWFRTPGISRSSAYGKYADRMHITGFFGGSSGSNNLDIDLDDVDSSGRGLWVYWNGGGTPQVWSAASTMGTWTDDAWYELSLVRSSGTITLYIRDTAGTVTTVDTETGAGVAIGSDASTVLNYIGRATDRGSGSRYLGFYGWIDSFEVWKLADPPVSGAIDWCPSLSGTQSTDTDGDYVGDDCDNCPSDVNALQEDVDADAIGDACDDCTDMDGDGYGDPALAESGCDPDCDDGDGASYPGAAEVAYDGVDQDCDGVDLTDVDGDGFDATAAGGDDCDDGDAAVNTGTGEASYDGVDNDCDPATPDDDLDGDGYTLADDCDDDDAGAYPGAAETPYDDVDQDCDGADLGDVDGDGFDATAAGGDDCDDADPDVSPGAAELPYDGVDNDCDPASPDDDVDGDGYTLAEDCDDADAGTYPGAEELPYDQVDQDCDGADLTDVDGDGVDAVEAGGADCDDGDPEVKPGAEELPYDGTDNDCDPSTPDGDLDADGYDGAVDCDDNNGAVNPGADEAPYDGVDNDCDPATPDDDLDGDGYPQATDCDDADPASYPGAPGLGADCAPVDSGDPGADSGGQDSGVGVDDKATGGGGCGCSSTPTRSPGWLALGLLFLLRRRRG